MTYAGRQQLKCKAGNGGIEKYNELKDINLIEIGLEKRERIAINPLLLCKTFKKMNNWYTVKVKFTKEFQDGTLKRVTEPYLVSSLSFTEAEARIYQEVGEFVRGEFLVTSIAKTDFADIFHYDDAETWYKCKVSYTTEDDSGKEKKVNNQFLVSAHNAKQAYERIEESLKGLMVSYEIPMITLTPIVEIYPYSAQEMEEVDKAINAKAAPKMEEEIINSPQINVAFNAIDEEE